MAASITLTTTTKRTDKGTVSLTLYTAAFGISGKVFAIEVYPTSADKKAAQYRFSHICSPQELSEFPEDEPLDNCYFRVDTIEMIFDGMEICEHVIANVKKDIAKLVSEYNKLDSVTPVVETTVFG